MRASARLTTVTLRESRRFSQARAREGREGGDPPTKSITRDSARSATMYMYTCTRTRARARARVGNGIPDTRRSGLPLAASVRGPVRNPPPSWPVTPSPLGAAHCASADGFTCAYDLAGSFPVWSKDSRDPQVDTPRTSCSPPSPPHPSRLFVVDAHARLSRCRATSWTSRTDEGKRKRERTPSTFPRSGVALETSFCCQTRVAESGDKKN